MKGKSFWRVWEQLRVQNTTVDILPPDKETAWWALRRAAAGQSGWSWSERMAWTPCRGPWTESLAGLWASRCRPLHQNKKLRFIHSCQRILDKMSPFYSVFFFIMRELKRITWLKNSCSRQSSQGSATAIGLASLEMSLTFTMIFISWKQERLVRSPLFPVYPIKNDYVPYEVVSLPLPCAPCCWSRKPAATFWTCWGFHCALPCRWPGCI